VKELLSYVFSPLREGDIALYRGSGCHIVTEPVPPSERPETFPAAVSALILKLLAKTAEERYCLKGNHRTFPATSLRIVCLHLLVCLIFEFEVRILAGR
jgi:hypothetical protein